MFDEGKLRIREARKALADDPLVFLIHSPLFLLAIIIAYMRKLSGAYGRWRNED